MSTARTSLALLLLAAALGPSGASLSAATKRSKVLVNGDTPAGQLMQRIDQETDPARKAALTEQFADKHAGHPGAVWVYAQMSGAYLKAGQFDKAIAAGEKVLALDPDDLEISYNNLKASEGKKSAPDVIRWSAETSKIARRVAAAPKAPDEEAADYAREVDYAKQVDIYTEYSLYATALQMQDPAQVVALGQSLAQRNAASKYLGMMYGPYFNALRQTGNAQGAVELGERAAAAGQANEDMLLLLADTYMQQKKEPAKVIAYSNKIVEILQTKPKPEGIGEADWNKKKTSLQGVANWMAGVTHAGNQDWPSADKSLRAAMPLLQGGDAAMNNIGLFYLGLANYNLGKAAKSRAVMQEALKFSEQAAALKGPLTAQAATNVKAIRAEMLKMPAAR